jgi:hypothetical protein
VIDFAQGAAARVSPRDRRILAGDRGAAREPRAHAARHVADARGQPGDLGLQVQRLMGRLEDLMLAFMGAV